MAKTKIKSEELILSRFIAIISVVAFIGAVVWIYFMYSAFTSIQQFSEATINRYQTEKVEMALARDFIAQEYGTEAEITHESRNENTFYFQGDEQDGAFMYVIEQVSPGEFEVVGGVSAINISTE